MIRSILLPTLLLLGVFGSFPTMAWGEEKTHASTRINLIQDDGKGQLQVNIDGKEALVYRYGDELDLVHYFPIRSPSGKSMTVQQTEPYPHHRSFWFGDTVQLRGRRSVSFYSPLYSRQDPDDPSSPFQDRVRHAQFEPRALPDHAAVVRSKLVWEMDRQIPVINESRELRIVPLEDGQYLLDLTFTLTAPTDDVTFLSDWVHYAWPFIRMNTRFSGDQGGTITNSEGAVSQANTNGQVSDGKAATWVDYSNTVEDQTEGLAIFSHPDNEHPHGWLTREYGCFGPRRADHKSGKRFTLTKGDVLRQRVGIYVHRGDVKTGRVAEHYEKYIRGAWSDDEPRKSALLPPGPGNPRNSEGDFIQLKDGRVFFIYTHFTGGGSDHATAFLAGRYSCDGGRTWSEDDVVVLPNEAKMNIMSVSLLRLQSGEVALFYLRKNSLEDCRPYMRISTDECQTWSEPKLCIDDEVGYYVMNNDRAVQLAGGRLLLPVALHHTPDQGQPDWAGRVMCYLSDDLGKSWQRSKSTLVGRDADGKRVTVQEPGVVALRDDRLMMFCRSNAGSQYVSYSTDDGETWSPLDPSNIISPLSPATLERIPRTGDLLLVWNNHDQVGPQDRGKRTPLSAAISRDEGKTWQNVKTLEDNPDGWYCYTAMAFVGDRVLLGHCAGNRSQGTGLGVTQITQLRLDWLYR